MILSCFVFVIYLPFVTSQNRIGFDAGIRLPWVQREPNSQSSPNIKHNHDLTPPLDPHFGETIAAVDQTEVRTIPNNKDINDPRFNPSTEFHDRHWGSRHPVSGWEHFIVNKEVSQIQDLLSSSSSFRNHNNFQSNDHNTRGQNDHHGMRKGSHHDHASDMKKGISHANDKGLHNSDVHSQRNTQLHGQNSELNTAHISETKENNNLPSTNSNTGNLLTGILQTLANSVVSGLVNQLARRNHRPTITLPGISQQSRATGRGFSSAFSPVGHVHGPHGEVVPLQHHGDHVHDSHGHVIPVSNIMPNSIGHRNSWNQNPFFHQSVRGSRGGWVLG